MPSFDVLEHSVPTHGDTTIGMPRERLEFSPRRSTGRRFQGASLAMIAQADEGA
jgi:hypothetical protein